MTKILIFAGSARLQSVNRQLATAVAQIARAQGGEANHIELADFNIPLYNADLEAAGFPADVLRLKQLMWEHPAWIICSPEYNGSYSALLKNTIDWATRPAQPDWADGLKPFRNKVVGVLSASPGALGGLRGQSHLVPLLHQLQCWVCPRSFALGAAGSAFDGNGALINPAHSSSVHAVVEQVIWAAERLAA